MDYYSWKNNRHIHPIHLVISHQPSIQSIHPATIYNQIVYQPDNPSNLRILDLHISPFTHRPLTHSPPISSNPLSTYNTSPTSYSSIDCPCIYTVHALQLPSKYQTQGQNTLILKRTWCIEHDQRVFLLLGERLECLTVQVMYLAWHITPRCFWWWWRRRFLGTRTRGRHE